MLQEHVSRKNLSTRGFEGEQMGEEIELKYISRCAVIEDISR